MTHLRELEIEQAMREGHLHMPAHKYPSVVIESPYRSSILYSRAENDEFVRFLCRHYTLLGFNPIASHIFYTEFLEDEVANERQLGIHFGLQRAATLNPILVTFHLREGESLGEGMSLALDFWKERPFPRVLVRWDATHENIVGVELFDG